MSESVNKAVMQGMAMEALNRPTTASEWFALLPDNEDSSSATSIVAPISEVPTIVVAPEYRSSHSEESPRTIATIERYTQMFSSQSRWFLPGVAVLATFRLSIVRYSFWRSQTSSSTEQTTPKTPSLFPETPP